MSETPEVGWWYGTWSGDLQQINNEDELDNAQFQFIVQEGSYAEIKFFPTKEDGLSFNWE